MVKDSLRKVYADDENNKPENEDEDTSDLSVWETDEESVESVDPVNGEQDKYTVHTYRERTKNVGMDDSEESQYDPEMEELLGDGKGAEPVDVSKESSEENFDNRLKHLQEEDQSDESGKKKLEGIPLVNKEQLEKKALEILNRRINSTQEHHKQISRISEVVKSINRRRVVESSNTFHSRNNSKLNSDW